MWFSRALQHGAEERLAEAFGRVLTLSEDKRRRLDEKGNVRITASEADFGPLSKAERASFFREVGDWIILRFSAIGLGTPGEVSIVFVDPADTRGGRAVAAKDLQAGRDLGTYKGIVNWQRDAEKLAESAYWVDFSAFGVPFHVDGSVYWAGKINHAWAWPFDESDIDNIRDLKNLKIINIDEAVEELRVKSFANCEIKPWGSILTLADIAANTELTIDYGLPYWQHETAPPVLWSLTNLSLEAFAVLAELLQAAESSNAIHAYIDATFLNGGAGPVLPDGFVLSRRPDDAAAWFIDATDSSDDE